jgi:hypothetical protein
MKELDAFKSSLKVMLLEVRQLDSEIEYLILHSILKDYDIEDFASDVNVELNYFFGKDVL